MPRCLIVTPLTAVLCLLLAASAHGASNVRVDIQSASGTTAPGYIAVTNTNRWDNSTSVDLGDGVRGAWLDSFGAGTGDRGASYPDVLMRDFVQWTGGQTTPETFKMTGIQPGPYDLKIYAYDPQYKDKVTKFEIDQDNDTVIDQTLTITNVSPTNEQNKTVPVVVSVAGVLSIKVSRPGTASAIFCGLDLTSTGPDPSQPAPITTLAITGQALTQVSLRWTAPADDQGTGGAVASYDIRYSTNPIDSNNWASASQVTGEPTPASPGTEQTFTAHGLSCNTTYYFAIKGRDASGYTAPLSNVVSTTTQAPVVPAAKSLAQRVADRTFPSVFQAWSPADNLPLENPRDTIARHDLYWSSPNVFYLSWDTATAGGYVLQSDGFIEDSIGVALQYRADLLSRNPNLILLAEIRQYEADDGSLPPDHPWWLRDGSGNRMLGWMGGPNTVYLLDLTNTSLQDHVAVQARAAVRSGVFDGVFLDCWTEFQNANARLSLVQKVRAAIGDQALIIVNPNHNKLPLTGPYINGLFMECYDTSTPAMWATITDTLNWAETNLVPNSLRVNCLESWYHNSRDDLDLMRATTTLSLTHSNGYALFSDPNPLSTSDHLHNWYSFWDADLGKPLQPGTDQPDGTSRREFTFGTVIYNPIGNTAPTVTFNEPRTSVATGLTATTHVVAAGGDIFLHPVTYRQRTVQQTLSGSTDFRGACGGSQTVTVAADGISQNTFNGIRIYSTWVYAGGSVKSAQFSLTEDPAADAGTGSLTGALTFRIVNAPTNMSYVGVSCQNIACAATANGDITMAQLGQTTMEFDYKIPAGMSLTCRAEPTGGGWTNRDDWGRLTGSGQWQHFSKTFDQGGNVATFLSYINAHQKSFNLVFTDFNTGTTGDVVQIDNVCVSQPVTKTFLASDINADGHVNVSDLLALVISWSKARLDPGYDAYADINDDGYVNVGDLQRLIADWGRSG